MTKLCGTCKVIKPIALFSRKLEGTQPNCKECTKELNLLYRRSLEGKMSSIYSDQKKSSVKRNHDMPTYTKRELLEWALTKGYTELHKLWVNSNYEHDLAPSVDRLDDNIGYTISNIRLCTWRDNYTKLHSDRVSGRNTKTSKPIRCYKGDVMVKQYVSAREASRSTGLHQSNISHVAKHGGYCGGYTWKYV